MVLLYTCLRKFKFKGGSDLLLKEGTRCDSPAASGSYGFPVKGAFSLLGLVMRVEVRVSARWRAQWFKRVASAFILWSPLHAKSPIARTESACIDLIAIMAQLRQPSWDGILWGWAVGAWGT